MGGFNPRNERTRVVHAFNKPSLKWRIHLSKSLFFLKKKERDLTQSYDKNPYTDRKSKKQRDKTKTSITQRLRTDLGRSVWGNDSHPTGVVEQYKSFILTRNMYFAYDTVHVSASISMCHSNGFFEPRIELQPLIRT